MGKKSHKQSAEEEQKVEHSDKNVLKKGYRGVKSGAAITGSLLEGVGDTLKQKRDEHSESIRVVATVAPTVLSRVASLNPAVAVTSSLLVSVAPEIVKGTGSSIRHLKQFVESPRKESKLISNGAKSKLSSVKQWSSNLKKEGERKNQEFRDVEVDTSETE